MHDAYLAKPDYIGPSCVLNNKYYKAKVTIIGLTCSSFFDRIYIAGLIQKSFFIKH